MSDAILRTKLTGDSAELQRALREGIDAAKEFGTEVGRAIKETALQISGLVLGVESVKEAFEKTFEGVKGVVDLSRDLRNLSNQTGASIRDLVQLRAEFDLSGIASDHVGNTLNRMQRAIEEAADKGGDASSIFGRLGLNVYELQKLNPAQQFEQLRESLSSIEDPARRAQVAMKLFGNMGGGGNILAVFGNSGIAKEAAEAIGQQANILARSSDTFQQVAMNMELASIRIEGFFVGMAEPISRVILPVLKQLNSIDLTKWGASIGESISSAMRVLYNAFSEDKLGTLFADALIYGADVGGNELVAVIKAAFDSIQPIMNAIFADNKFGEGFSQILVGAAGEFGAALAAAFKLPLQVLEYGLAKASGNTVSAAATAIRMAGIVQNESMKERGYSPEEQAKTLKWYEDKANSLDAKGNPIANMSFEDYKKMSDSSFFLGTNGTDLGAASREIREQGQGKLTDVFTRALENVGKDVHLTKSDVFGAGAAGDALKELIAGLGGKIPGEGTSNAPDGGIRQGGGDEGRFGQVQGIVKDGQGNWSFMSSGGNGAVSFGNDGVAGRAGRVQDSPDGKSPSDMFSDALKLLTKIESDISGITAPA